MKIMTRTKRNGKTRTIYCPEELEKRRLRSLVPMLNMLAEEVDVHRIQHGFTEGRSPVTNAQVHVGWEFTVSFDLTDFFDSVKREHVAAALTSEQLKKLEALIPDTSICFPDGAARQGLPTSPALSNIAASPMDKEIMSRCQGGRFHEKPWVFSRYVDDLTFSCRTKTAVDWLLVEIPKIVERHGFKINTGKTKVQWAGAGRRIITGIAVGKSDIQPPRYVRKRIRAGKHQEEHGITRQTVRRLLFNRRSWRRRLPLTTRLRMQLQGLEQWAKLRKPKNVCAPKFGGLTQAATRIVQAVAGKAMSEKIGRAFGRLFG